MRGAVLSNLGSNRSFGGAAFWSPRLDGLPGRNGPLPTLGAAFRCCDRSPHSGRSNWLSHGSNEDWRATSLGYLNRSNNASRLFECKFMSLFKYGMSFFDELGVALPLPSRSTSALFTMEVTISHATDTIDYELRDI